MLDWLKNLLFPRGYDDVASPPRAGMTSGFSVVFDERLIIVQDAAGQPRELPWGAIAGVIIETTSAGPFVTDLFWHIEARDPRQSLVVPMDADGEHELLKAMQSRLQGFDNMAVVEAMSSTDDAQFKIWPATDAADGS